MFYRILNHFLNFFLIVGAWKIETDITFQNSAPPECFSESEPSWKDILLKILSPFVEKEKINLRFDENVSKKMFIEITSENEMMKTQILDEMNDGGFKSDMENAIMTDANLEGCLIMDISEGVAQQTTDGKLRKKNYKMTINFIEICKC